MVQIMHVYPTCVPGGWFGWTCGWGFYYSIQWRDLRITWRAALAIMWIYIYNKHYTLKQHIIRMSFFISFLKSTIIPQFIQLLNILSCISLSLLFKQCKAHYNFILVHKIYLLIENYFGTTLDNKTMGNGYCHMGTNWINIFSSKNIIKLNLDCFGCQVLTW